VPEEYLEVVPATILLYTYTLLKHKYQIPTTIRYNRDPVVYLSTIYHGSKFGIFATGSGGMMVVTVTVTVRAAVEL
jgi:hypothetical protein